MPSRLRRTLPLLSFLAACGPLPTENTAATPDLATVEQGLAVTATYDSTRMAPRCGSVSSSCSSGTLLNGRAALGPETNAPNTLNKGCADGTAGSYHSDESLDALRIYTVDGTDLAAGKQVRVEATVWAYVGYSADFFDLYQSTDGSATWSYVTTITATKAGSQVLTATFTLPPGGSTRAIRGQFRYGGSAGSCVAGSFNDADDLLFAVASAAVDGGAGSPPDAGSGVGLALVNPGFESGLTGWSVTGSGATTVTGGHTGSALSLTLSGSLTATVKQQVQTTGPGTLTLRGWFRNTSVTSPSSQGITLQAQDVNFVSPGLQYLDCSGSPSTSWTQVTCDLTPFAGKLISINIYSPNAVLVDDLALTAVAFSTDAGVSVSGGAGDQPVVTNGGFESGSSGWALVGDGAVTSGSSRTGTMKAGFTSSSSPMPTYPGGNAVTQALPASTSPITVTAYFRPTVAATNSTVTITVIEANGSAGGCGSVNGTTSVWTKVTCSFFGSTQARTLRFDGYSTTGQQLLIDDVAIEPLTNGSFEYGQLGWGTAGTVANDSSAGAALDGSTAEVLRPSFGAPALLAQTFTRRANTNWLSLAFKWESACQSCNNSSLTMTLSAPGYPSVKSQLSNLNLVGWYNTSQSLSSFPVGTPVTVTLRADSALAPNTTEFFRVDNVQTY